MLGGLFLPLKTVFACELMDGKAQSVCCCNEPDDMSKGCTIGGGCQDQALAPTTPADCCEVSYREAPIAKAAAPAAASIQVLVLNAPQPPPIPAAFDIAPFTPVGHTPRLTRFLPPRVTGTDTYLLTNRFRI